jgi:hypothetical protein
MFMSRDIPFSSVEQANPSRRSLPSGQQDLQTPEQVRGVVQNLEQ